jgi:hypothetical protein
MGIPLTARSKCIIPFDLLFLEGDSRRSRGTIVIFGWLTRHASQWVDNFRATLQLTLDRSQACNRDVVRFLVDLMLDDYDDECEPLEGWMLSSWKSETSLHMIRLLVCLYLLHPFCMWTPNPSLRTHYIVQLSQRTPALNCHGFFRQDAEGVRGRP